MSIRQAVRYRVRGGQRIEGTVIIQGAKNAVLPIIAASLLAKKGQTILHNVPLINDVYVAIEIARSVGARVKLHEEEQVLVIDASTISSSILPSHLTNLIRGSILFLPSLMIRTGQASIEKVGGCNLGKRSLDFHYRGFARLGAEVSEDEQAISITLKNHQGAYLYLDTPSHTGTENLMMAASLAKGKTTIENAALEPEIADVANFLNRMGAKISGISTGIIEIEGVNELSAVEYTIMPDRIDAGTMAILAAATQGDVTLIGANLRHLGVVRAKLEQMGVELQEDGPVIRVQRQGPLRPVNIITWPYPGYPTDLQSPLMTLTSIASGTSYIRETLFEQRFGIIKDLNRMGANITLEDNSAVIKGPSQLFGATVWAHDLRAGSALIIAGAIAEGETIIENAQMIERGYSAVLRRFSRLGLQLQEEREEQKEQLEMTVQS